MNQCWRLRSTPPGQRAPVYPPAPAWTPSPPPRRTAEFPGPPYSPRAAYWTPPAGSRTDSCWFWRRLTASSRSYVSSAGGRNGGEVAGKKLGCRTLGTSFQAEKLIVSEDCSQLLAVFTGRDGTTGLFPLRAPLQYCVNLTPTHQPSPPIQPLPRLKFWNIGFSHFFVAAGRWPARSGNICVESTRRSTRPSVRKSSIRKQIRYIMILMFNR